MSLEWIRRVWELPRDCGVTPTQRLILLALADYADRSGQSYPAQRSLARKVGLSRETVTRNLRILEDMGLVRATTKGRTKLYQLRVPTCDGGSHVASRPVTQNHMTCDAASHQRVTERHTEPVRTEPVNEPLSPQATAQQFKGESRPSRKAATTGERDNPHQLRLFGLPEKELRASLAGLAPDDYYDVIRELHGALEAYGDQGPRIVIATLRKLAGYLDRADAPLAYLRKVLDVTAGQVTVEVAQERQRRIEGERRQRESAQREEERRRDQGERRAEEERLWAAFEALAPQMQEQVVNAAYERLPRFMRERVDPEDPRGLWLRFRVVEVMRERSPRASA